MSTVAQSNSDHYVVNMFYPSRLGRPGRFGRPRSSPPASERSPHEEQIEMPPLPSTQQVLVTQPIPQRPPPRVLLDPPSQTVTPLLGHEGPRLLQDEWYPMDVLNNNMMPAEQSSLDDRIQAMQSTYYLPSNDGNADSRMQRLYYLALISQPNENRAPCTEVQEAKFSMGQKYTNRTTFWLKWGKVPVIAFSIFGGLAGLSSLATGTIVQKLVFGAVVGIISNIATNVLSYIFTGDNPDNSCTAVLESTNQFTALKKMMENAAYELIDCYFSENQDDAIEIAKKLKCEKIRNLLHEKCKEKEGGPPFGDRPAEFLLVGILQEAVDYILNEADPWRNPVFPRRNPHPQYPAQYPELKTRILIHEHELLANHHQQQILA